MIEERPLGDDSRVAASVSGLPPFEAAMAERLRTEVEAMSNAYVDALLDHAPTDSIVGIYVKGSAYKSWDTMVDYVPELSDVDIHVRIRPESRDDVRSLGFSLRVADDALASFESQMSEPLHVPRPQLQLLNDVEALPGYLPSPAGVIHTLHGADYAGAERSDYEHTRATDIERFLHEADFVLAELGSKVIDRPGARFWDVARRFSWTIGPAGPRILSWAGVHPFDAWSMSRSGVIRELVELGLAALAEAYGDYYLAGWEGFRSGFTDVDSARRALRAMDRVYRLGSELVSD